MITSYNPSEKRIEVTIPIGKKVDVTMTTHAGCLKQIYFGTITDPYGTYFKIFDSRLDPSDPCFLSAAPLPPATCTLTLATANRYIMPVYELLGSANVEKYFAAPTVPPNDPNAPVQSYTFIISPNPLDNIVIQMTETAGGRGTKSKSKPKRKSAK